MRTHKTATQIIDIELEFPPEDVGAKVVAWVGRTVEMLEVEGRFDGLSVGSLVVGDVVLPFGDIEGLGVGDVVGSMLGMCIFEGFCVGILDDLGVGDSESLTEGDGEGERVVRAEGFGMGPLLGLLVNVGFAVGFLVLGDRVGFVEREKRNKRNYPFKEAGRRSRPTTP